MGAMILTGKGWITWRKMCLPICPPQILYGLAWDQTWVCAVGGSQKLTVWAMVWSGLNK